MHKYSSMHHKFCWPWYAKNKFFKKQSPWMFLALAFSHWCISICALRLTLFAWDCLDKCFVGLKLYHLLKRIFQGKGQFWSIFSLTERIWVVQRFFFFCFNIILDSKQICPKKKKNLKIGKMREAVMLDRKSNFLRKILLNCTWITWFVQLELYLNHYNKVN